MEREQNAAKIQREEILLWRVSGGSYLSNIYPSKEKREGSQAGLGDPPAAQSAAHRGAAFCKSHFPAVYAMIPTRKGCAAVKILFLCHGKI